MTEALEALAYEIDATSSAVGEVFGADLALEPGDEGAEVVQLTAAEAEHTFHDLSHLGREENTQLGEGCRRIGLAIR